MKGKNIKTMIIVVFGLLLILVVCGFFSGRIVFGNDVKVVYVNNTRTIYVPNETVKTEIVYVNQTVIKYLTSETSSVFTVSYPRLPSKTEIVMSDSVLRDLGVFSTTKEYSYCISGSIGYDRISGVSTYNFRRVDSSNVGELSYVVNNCDSGIFAHIHTHPNGVCKASNNDIEYFKYMAKGGTTMFLIRCGEDKFVVYTQLDYSAGYIWNK